MKSMLKLFSYFLITISSSEANSDDHTVLCRTCGMDIADPQHLKVSSTSPFYLERQNVSMFGSKLRIPVEQLENPAGIEFRVVTFTKAGCIGVGDWTSEASWYPGYLWKVCVCPHCQIQLGWIFEPKDTAVKELLKPSDAGFYAVIVKNVFELL